MGDRRRGGKRDKQDDEGPDGCGAQVLRLSQPWIVEPAGQEGRIGRQRQGWQRPTGRQST